MRAGKIQGNLRVLCAVTVFAQLLGKARKALVIAKQAALDDELQKSYERSYLLRRAECCRRVVEWALSERSRGLVNNKIMAELYSEQTDISENSILTGMIVDLLYDEAGPLPEARGHDGFGVFQSKEEVCVDEGQVSDFVYGVAAVWRAVNIRAWVVRGQYNYRAAKAAKAELARMNAIAASMPPESESAGSSSAQKGASFGHDFRCFPAMGVCYCDKATETVQKAADTGEMTYDEVQRECLRITERVFKKHGRDNRPMRQVVIGAALTAFRAEGVPRGVWEIAMKRADNEDHLVDVRRYLSKLKR